MRNYFNEAQNDYSTYHYILNAQGDVIKLMHGSNKTVAEYSYDAWGKLLRISGAEVGNLSVANLNPLRYRGYYCDGETGFYYLQSRYYDPIVRRFLNSDSYGSTGQGILGYNMFAYCNNNPVMSYDPTGHSNEAYDEWIYGAGGGSAMGAAAEAAVAVGALAAGSAMVDAMAGAATKLATTVADAVFGGSSSAATNQKNGASSGSKNKVKSATVSTPASPPPNNNRNNKQRKGTPKNNQAQNKQVDDIARQYKLTKYQREMLHDEIHGQDCTFQEIEELAKEIIQLYSK